MFIFTVRKGNNEASVGYVWAWTGAKKALFLGKQRNEAT